MLGTSSSGCMEGKNEALSGSSSRPVWIHTILYNSSCNQLQCYVPISTCRVPHLCWQCLSSWCLFLTVEGFSGKKGIITSPILGCLEYFNNLGCLGRLVLNLTCCAVVLYTIHSSAAELLHTWCNMWRLCMSAKHNSRTHLNTVSLQASWASRR